MGKTVLITGASSGIGRATALLFLERGWNVVATMRNPARARSAGFPLSDSRLLVAALDVTDEQSVAEAVSQALARFGVPDALVNNAAYGPMAPLETMPSEEIDQVFRTNSIGPLRVTRALLPAMREQGRGRIINVSSMGGEFTTPYAGIYHASKYALESISDALRTEIAPFGIDVVVIQPGPVATELASSAVAALRARAVGPYAAPLAAMADATERQISNGRGVLRPEQVAAAILTAAEARQPATRIKIGAVARILPFLRRHLSDRLWDAMLRRMMALPRVAAPAAATKTQPQP